MLSDISIITWELGYLCRNINLFVMKKSTSLITLFLFNKTAIVTIMNLDTGEAIHYNVSTNDCSISIDLGNNQSESNYNIELILDNRAYTGEFTTNEI